MPLPLQPPPEHGSILKNTARILVQRMIVGIADSSRVAFSGAHLQSRSAQVRVSRDEFFRMRESMLRVLRDVDSRSASGARASIGFAATATDLWFTRVELFAAVSSAHGQAVAVERLGEVDKLFLGHSHFRRMMRNIN